MLGQWKLPSATACPTPLSAATTAKGTSSPASAYSAWQWLHWVLSWPNAALPLWGLQQGNNECSSSLHSTGAKQTRLMVHGCWGSRAQCSPRVQKSEGSLETSVQDSDPVPDVDSELPSFCHISSSLQVQTHSLLDYNSCFLYPYATLLQGSSGSLLEDVYLRPTTCWGQLEHRIRLELRRFGFKFPVGQETH